MRELVEDDEITVKWVGTKEQLADIFTKILAGSQLDYMVKTLHLLKPEEASGGVL